MQNENEIKLSPQARQELEEEGPIWLAELNGTPFARLSDSKLEDCFWDSYKIDYIENEFVPEQDIYNSNFWHERMDQISYKNVQTGAYSSAAYPMGSTGEHRLTFRGLRLYMCPDLVNTPHSSSNKPWWKFWLH